MKSILSLIIALIIMMIAREPRQQESFNDTTFDIISIGSPPVDIYQVIQASVSETMT